MATAQPSPSSIALAANAMTPDDAPALSSDKLRLLVIGALGVVFGDIGTSPLYTVTVCFTPGTGVDPSRLNILGVMSLVFWALVIVVTLKYLALVLQADHKGEGGILALMTLVTAGHGKSLLPRGALVVLGLFGAALLYGDGMVTPAMSVLSAVEGLQIASPKFQHGVLPVTIVILIGLFLAQSRGTRAVGAVFGPIMVVWFAVIALLGLWWIARRPEVLLALNPSHAYRMLTTDGHTGYLLLGAVFLAVTGGEALYADLGHFGKRPIRVGWCAIVLPALALNYFGQGALLLDDPSAVDHVFYRMSPDWALYPMVALATIATVIASQAIISGAFSLTTQALQLGFSPNVEVRHYSADGAGQVYVPFVNGALMIATVGLVLAFQTSSNLAGAYGVAVSTTMVVTTALVFVYFRRQRNWSLIAAAAVCGPLLLIDLAFWGSNLAKVGQGGWFPLMVGLCVYVVMSTWKRGREILDQRLAQTRIRVEDFIRDTAAKHIQRIPGTAVYLTSDMAGAPLTLLKNLAHNKALHENIVLLTIVTEESPRVAARDRVDVRSNGDGFVRLVAHYGFMQTPNVPSILRLAETQGVRCTSDDMTYFLRRESLLVTDRPGMARWRKRLFVVLSHNSQDLSLRFRIPPADVIGIDIQVEL